MQIKKRKTVKKKTKPCRNKSVDNKEETGTTNDEANEIKTKTEEEDKTSEDVEEQ